MKGLVVEAFAKHRVFVPMAWITRVDALQVVITGVVTNATGEAVGGAVVRNRTKRRLRHAMRDRVETLPRGLDVVVRANPPAAEADHARLAAELDRLLARCLAKVRP